jgi:DNA repair protein RadC
MKTRKDKANEYATMIAQAAAYVAEAKPICREPVDAYRLLAPLMAGELQESFWIIPLNARNRVMSAPVMITKGLANSAPVHPREAFRPAIVAGASSMIIAHNHPSGDVTPSAEDIIVTKRLIEAGKVVGINVMDHVIIGVMDHPGQSPFLSLRDRGLCTF